MPQIAILHYTAPPIVGGVEAIISEHARLLNEAGFPTRLIVGRGGDGGLPAGQPITLIPEIDTGSHTHPDLAEALDRGEVSADLPPRATAPIRSGIGCGIFTHGGPCAAST
jgi:hypothetical protein